MLPQEIIRKKREGHALEPAEVAFMIDGLTRGTIGEAQAAAFAMAVYFRGMEPIESIALTLAMRNSGSIVDWSDLDGIVLDKHSTGGIGDNVSLMLAPAIAACGAFVPMISGRGLGHTGGTLDKLDAIPGYVSQPDLDRFRRVVADVGCAVIGQTAELAPADRLLYAIRDVTATVESIPLITASILSKKLAAGLEGLVLDVKTGNGAFMQKLDDSRKLAETLVAVASGAGLATRALVTDMSQPLASAAGNAVEVLNAVEFLTGAHIDQRLKDVTVALGAEMLLISGIAGDEEQAKGLVDEAFTSGRAAEKFGKMVAALGGPADFMERPRSYLDVAPIVRAVTSEHAGFVRSVETRTIGVAVVELGGGRARASDPVDPAVGFTGLAPIGAAAGPDRPLAIVHARSDAAADRAAAALRAAYSISEEAVAPPKLIYERII